MWDKAQALLDRAESRLSLIIMIAGTGIFGGITGYLSTGVDFIYQRLGIFGFWIFAMLGALTFLAIYALYGFGRERMAVAHATRYWKESTQHINPLDSEFNKKRINIHDLAHPATNKIKSKRLIDCELFGPANIFLSHGCHLNGIVFSECDFVVTKQDLKMINAIILEDVSLIGGSIYRSVIIIHPSILGLLESNLKPYYISSTGIPDIDQRQPPKGRF